jgi:hypothetical protein
MTWSTSTNGPPLVVLYVVYKQRVSIALQRTHVASILKHTIVVSEHLKNKLHFQVSFHFPSLMLLAISGGFGT